MKSANSDWNWSTFVASTAEHSCVPKVLVKERAEPRTSLGWLMNADVEYLSRRITFDEFERVYVRLLADVATQSVLLEALDEIRTSFGESTQLIMNVQEDPESPADDALVLTVLTGSGSVTQSLRDFDASWWRDAASRAPFLTIDAE